MPTTLSDIVATTGSHDASVGAMPHVRRGVGSLTRGRQRFDLLPSEDEYRLGFRPIIGMGDETQDIIERDATILRLYAAGKRWPVIMAAAGCSEGTAVTVVRRAGLPLRRSTRI